METNAKPVPTPEAARAIAAIADSLNANCVGDALLSRVSPSPQSENDSLRNHPLVQSGRMSPSIQHLAKALALAQGEMGAAKKTAENPFFKSSYADLGSAVAAAREALCKYELAVTQLPEILSDWKFQLRTILMHSSGEWISSLMPLQPAKSGPQEFGSYLTYQRRYAYLAILGLATEDDDGQSAQEQSDQASFLKAQKPTVTAPVSRPKLSPSGQVLADAGKKMGWQLAQIKELLDADYGYQKPEQLTDKEMAGILITLRNQNPEMWRNARQAPPV